MSALVTVAVSQLAIGIGEVEANRAAAAAAVTEAASRGAQIVVLPELTPSGYVFNDAAEARALGEPADGPTVTQWSGLAAEHDLVIVGGFAELGGDGHLYNSAMLVDGSGPRAVYRKVHLWDAEADFFTPGAGEPPVVDTKFGRIAVMICYDVEFPEWVRLPALAGAELLAVPTNWPAERVPAGERPMVTVNVQVAAFANRMFVAAACRCADERGVSWVGGSIIAGPDGYPLAGPASVGGVARHQGVASKTRQVSTASKTRQVSTASKTRHVSTASKTRQVSTASSELLVADCDLAQARNKATGPRNDAHADRRPELYRFGTVPVTASGRA